MKTATVFILAAILTAASALADVSLTVYQRDLVLVRDVRTVDLERGRNRIVFNDIAPGINEPTLRIIPRGNPSDLKTVEQSYEYDLADEDRIWSKFLGKSFQFTKDDSLYTGILRNFDDDHIYLEPEGKPGAVAMIGRSGIKDMTFEALPEGLVLRPEVVWVVNSGKKRSHQEVEISYLTGGINWQADYTASISKPDVVRLVGNVTLSNTLDIDFKDARIDLIAGDLHRSFDSRRMGGGDVFSAPDREGKETGARFFEYRHYQLPEATSLHASQTKGVPLIGPVNVACEKNFFYDGSSSEEEVVIRLLINNDEKSGLGIALPEGDLLLYQENDKGTAYFLGEDHLQASSPGDKVELTIGKAFDLRVDRKRVSHQRISRNRTKDNIEIIFGSSRENVSKITVRERLYGFWDIVEAQWNGKPLDYRSTHANQIEFDLELAPGVTDTLRYVVEYGY